MGRQTPPLQAVEAFLFATRTQNFRIASEQLSLSPSAFSRRIKSLEDFLGVALFDRSLPSPKLTEAGEAYRRQIEPALEAIRSASVALRDGGDTNHVRVMSPHSVAITWLMPRLSGFVDRHPEFEIDIVISRDLGTLRNGQADIAIVSGPRSLGDLPSQPLTSVTSISGALVSAPMLAGGRTPPRSFRELASHRLLAVDTPPDIWPRWLSAVGYGGEALPEPVKFETLLLMYEAAANGLGVTLAFPAITNRFLRDGRLRPCFDACANLDWNYCLVYRNARTMRRPAIRKIAAWMDEEMNDSITAFSTMIGCGQTSMPSASC